MENRTNNNDEEIIDFLRKGIVNAAHVEAISDSGAFEILHILDEESKKVRETMEMR